MAEMNPLRRRMIEDMKIRNLSPRTQRCYVHAVAKFAQHFNRSPDRLGLAENRSYQIHLTSTGTSWAGFNVAVCALRFFYGITLGRAAMVDRIPYARKRRQLPVILSIDEIARFLAAVPSLKHRTALMTAYAAGLRVSEVVHLKIADIDSSRMLIRVEQGRAVGTAMSCCRHSSSLFGAPIGGKPGRRIGCFRAKTRAGHSTRACCSGHAETRGQQPSSASRSLSTCSGTVSPPICSKPAPTSARSRCCWVIAIYRRRRAIPKSPPRQSATRPARSTG
jgi:integrase